MLYFNTNVGATLYRDKFIIDSIMMTCPHERAHFLS